MASQIIGYIGAIIASIFFGSNYVPTKNYPTGDGMAFVYVFANGVLTVGIISMFIAKKSLFIYSGILGGSLWAMGNLCVIPIVKFIGLGLGMLIWGSTSLITGFISGKFGLFGLTKTRVEYEAMNWGGFACILIAMGVFFFIKPTLEDDEPKSPLLDPVSVRSSVQDVYPKKPIETSIFDRVSPSVRTPVGIIMAILSGMLYGVNMVPMSLWVQSEKAHGNNPGPLDFVMSHFIGIYLFSTVVFLVYCAVSRPPQVFPRSMLPSFISGAMWGIAQVGLMSATQILSYAVGFPIGSTGPSLVSSLWSVLYFREIRGGRNFLFLGASLSLLIVGITLVALSKPITS